MSDEKKGDTDRWEDLCKFRPMDRNEHLENAPWLYTAICISNLGKSLDIEDSHVIESIMNLNIMYSTPSLLILKDCKIQPLHICSIEKLLRLNLRVEEFWVENAPGFSLDFIQKVQEENPFIRFKIDGKTEGHTTFLLRKVHLCLLRKARQVILSGPSTFAQCTFTNSCIYWDESNDLDAVWKLVSINYSFELCTQCQFLSGLIFK